jgi:uncharacterized membrane protein YbhN (UPF0104 family)
MTLTRAIMVGGIAGIALPFAVGGSAAPAARLVSMILIHGPNGVTIPWSWSAFCVVTLMTWGLLQSSR